MDTIVILRYLEIQGEIRKALGVLKKRMTDHERRFAGLEPKPIPMKTAALR